MTTTCMPTSLTPPPEAMARPVAWPPGATKPRQPSSPRQFFARIYGDLEDVKTPPTTPSPSLPGAEDVRLCKPLALQALHGVEDLRKPIAIRSFRNPPHGGTPPGALARPADPLRSEDNGHPGAVLGAPRSPFALPPAAPMRLVPASTTLPPAHPFPGVAAPDSCTFPASFSAFREYRITC